MLIRKNYFEVEKIGRKNSVIWNNKDSNSIHVDSNHPNLKQPIPENLTHIISINDSADICSKYIIIVGIFGTYTLSGTHYRNIYLWDSE